MKNYLSFLVLMFTVAIFAACDETDKPTPIFQVTTYEAKAVSKTNSQLTFMHYMPWFETKESNNGQWGSHWKMATRNPDIMEGDKHQIASHYYPLIGPYASSDPDVIEYHLLLMKYAGVDGLLIDWYGITDYLDYPQIKHNTDVLISKIEKVGLMYAIVYEDRTIKTAANNGLDRITTAQADMSYIEYEYFSDANYWKVDGKPILMVFGPEEFHKPEEWSAVFSKMTNKPKFLTLFGFSNQAGNAASGEYIWVDTQNMNTKYAAKNNFDVFVGGAYTGFNDYYFEGGWGDGLPFEIDHNNGLLYKELLDKAKAEAVDYVQLITWNDFGEGTMIEPTVEFGFTFLDYTQDFTGVSYTTAELEMIHELFKLRKRISTSTEQYKKLDQAYYYLISLQNEKAKEIIDELK